MILRKDYRKDTNLFKNIVLYMMTRFGLIFWCILFFLNNKKLLESIEMTFFMVCLCIFIGYIPLYLEFILNGGVDLKGLWEKQQLKKANELLLEGKNIVEISHEVRIPIDYLSKILQLEIGEREKEQGYKYKTCAKNSWGDVFKALGTKKDVIEITGPTYGIFGIKNEMD